MILNVSNIINSKNAVNPSSGLQLLDVLSQHSNQSTLTISFEGLKHLSTAFLNDSIGVFLLKNPQLKLDFHYPSDKPLFELKVQDVLENVSISDSFDEIVEAAYTA